MCFLEPEGSGLAGRWCLPKACVPKRSSGAAVAAVAGAGQAVCWGRAYALEVASICVRRRIALRSTAAEANRWTNSRACSQPQLGARS